MGRFTVIGNAELLVLEDKKAALAIELQEGKADDENFELVVQEMYWKTDVAEWAYCRGGVRLPCTKENVQHVLTSVKAMFDVSTKSKKEVKQSKNGKVTTESITEYLKTLKAEDLTALLATLAKTEKPEPKKKAAPKKQEQTADEILLNSIMDIVSKGKGGKK